VNPGVAVWKAGPRKRWKSWRDAVNGAIYAGLTDTAADWLYAIRNLNVKHGPRTEERCECQYGGVLLVCYLR
jgi:hypothetical protein